MFQFVLFLLKDLTQLLYSAIMPVGNKREEVLMTTSNNPTLADFDPHFLSETVRLAAKGDEAAFSRLALVFQPVIARIVSAYSLPEADRHDLCQEGLIGLYKAVLLYNPDLASFSTFATVCIRSGVLEGLRKYQKENHPFSADLTEDEIPADSSLSPERIFLGKEALSGLLSKLDDALSPLERKVLGLHLAGKKNPAIAEILGKDIKSVENTLFRLRKKLSTLS